MRLIDADNIHVEPDLIKVDNYFNPYILLSDLIKIIDLQRTAFNYDKVIKQLEDWTFNADINAGDGTTINHNLIVSKNAIEIIEQKGLQDDVVFSEKRIVRKAGRYNDKKM